MACEGSKVVLASAMPDAILDGMADTTKQPPTRLRIVQIPTEPVKGEVQFGNPENGYPLDHWADGIVVMLGNEDAPDHVTVFDHGEPTWFAGNEQFTPRCEDWSECNVVVLHDNWEGRR